MSAVTLGSVGRSPGVSTAWLLTAMAAGAAGHEVMACEADPSGNDVAVMFDVGVNPGLVTLAAAGRRGLSHADGVGEHGRRVADGVTVVPGPVAGEESVTTVDAIAPTLAELAARDHRLWLFDVGRLWSGSVAVPLARASALTMLVCRPAPLGCLALPSRVAALRAAGCRQIGLVCVGKGPYAPAEIARYAGASLVGCLAEERDAADVVTAVVAGRGRRTLLWRQGVELAAAVHWYLSRSSAESTDAGGLAPVPGHEGGRQ